MTLIKKLLIAVPVFLSFNLSSCSSYKNDSATERTKVQATITPKPSIQSISPHTEKPDELTVKSENEPSRLVELNNVRGELNRLKGKSPHSKQLIQLNFVNAPAEEVAKTIIASSLGKPLAISEAGSKPITLMSPEPVTADIALRALEEVLLDSGLALLQTEAGYELTTTKIAGEKAHALHLSGRGGLGYGVTVHPLRYTTASDITRLIQPFLSKNIIVSHDDVNNLIFLKGTQVDVNTTIETIKLFDTPWLTDKFFALYELHHAEIDGVIRDIETVLNTQNSDKLKHIQLAPLHRINAIFVTTNSRQQLQTIEKWITRFDVPVEVVQRGIFFYQAQFKPASELAATLKDLFGSNQASTIPLDENHSKSASNRSSTPKPEKSRMTIVSDETNDAIIIKAEPNELAEIKSLLKQMDQYTPQVLIEATIAEVILNDDLRYGVQWFRENDRSQLSSTTNSSGTVGPEFPGFSYTFMNTNVEFALTALESLTDVTVLSAPSLMVQNNQTAQLQVGDQVPIVTQQAQNTTSEDAPIISSVQLRDTGVILEVKPRINASDMVSIEVKQEVSDVAQTTTSGIDSPTIQQRKLSSTVSVKNGHTIALGGLIRETVAESNSGVPFLKDIPLVGNLFKSNDHSTRRTELIIFLTPKILRQDSDNESTFEYLKADMKVLRERFKDID